MALVNVCALPYSFWSVWYQKYRINQWCPLCLIVQLVLWALFFVNVFSGWISVPAFQFTSIIFTACIYLLPFLILNAGLPFISSYFENRINRLRLNHIKLKDEVFLSILKKQPKYKTGKDLSVLTWGKKEAGIQVTILTNPHCPPCAAMHKRIDKILEKAADKVCVRYVFSSYSEEYDISAVFLIAVFMSDKLSEQQKKDIYNEWFDNGKRDKEKFFKKYNLEMDFPEAEKEFEKHKIWKFKNELFSTPTILINGYELPAEYTIEDILNFTSLDV